MLAIVLFLAGCGQAAPTVTPTLTPPPSSTPSLTPPPTSTPNPSLTPSLTSSLTPTPTPNPSLTPSLTPTRAPAIPEAGIELISGMPDGCVNTDQNQSTVFGFNVVYHTVTTGNYQTGMLVAPDGAVLATVNSETENRDGEGRWGFYPSAFDYPANTSLTMTLTTYSGIDATTPISSISTLTYNCTTGEAINQTYTRGE
ncbi:MAG: hypothetical protein ABI700_01250 [Chloroflexota bacterium]